MWWNKNQDAQQVSLPTMESSWVDYQSSIQNSIKGAASILSLQNAIAFASTEPPTLRGYDSIFDTVSTGTSTSASIPTFTNSSATEEGVPTGFTPQIESQNNYANLLNASMTGLFTKLASIYSTWSSSKIYDLYEQQEELYVENAKKQAERLKVKGDIALANLRAKHALSEGTNVLAAAASGAGALSGSTLDKLMANKKYDTRDELSQSYETTWAVDNALRNGYIQAYSTATKAYSMALTQRNNAVSSLLKGAAATVNALLTDKNQQIATESAETATNIKQATEQKKAMQYYSNAETTRTLSVASEAGDSGKLFGNVSGEGLSLYDGESESGSFDLGGFSAAQRYNLYSLLDLDLNNEPPIEIKEGN